MNGVRGAGPDQGLARPVRATIRRVLSPVRSSTSSHRPLFSALICAVALGLTALSPLGVAAQETPVPETPTENADAPAPLAPPTAKPVPRPTPPASTEAKGARGAVTNLPLPRFVSLKANEANLRRGPSLGHRIDWVFKRRGTPLEVIAEYGHWRRVRDNEDATGWIHYTLISGVRMALVIDETVDLFSKPDSASRLNAHAERGVILRLLECDISWCKASVGRQKGWVLKSGLWGVYDGEVLD